MAWEQCYYHREFIPMVDNVGNSWCIGERIPWAPTAKEWPLYRRDWLIAVCAYRLQQQEKMRLLYVSAY